jgi:hypothetical protein
VVNLKYSEQKSKEEIQMGDSNEKWLPLELPSKCLAYESVDSSKLFIRPLKGKDEKLIAEISGNNFEKKFVTLLKSIIQGIDPLILTLGDRLYIMVWEAINSYSSKLIYNYECEYCWQPSDYNIDLGKLEIIELPTSYKQPYEINLPESGETIKLKLLTVGDNLKIEEMAKLNQNTWLYRFAHSIVSTNKNIFDVVSYLENLPAKDIALIRTFQEKFTHGPKMELKYECPKCGGVGIMPIPFRIQMLFPYGKDLTKYFGDAI